MSRVLASDLAASPPSLVVNINEVSTFNGPKGNKQSSTSAPFIYSFILEDGRWLIHDVRRQ